MNPNNPEEGGERKVRGSATESYDGTVRRFGREAHRPIGFAALRGDHELPGCNSCSLRRRSDSTYCLHLQGEQ
jgi:hypothetical protein